MDHDATDGTNPIIIKVSYIRLRARPHRRDRQSLVDARSSIWQAIRH